jgi:peptide-methionine (R)-S-oxide reductase
MSDEKVTKSDAEWRSELTPQQYEVLREAGTERPFTGAYTYNKASGTYRCAGCGAELFGSDTKFDSGTGWPSFTEPAFAEAVELRPDNSLLMRRTEVLCRRCGGHLGHVFDDGPAPTGQRFCINSAALDFHDETPAEGAHASGGGGEQAAATSSSEPHAQP